MKTFTAKTYCTDDVKKLQFESEKPFTFKKRDFVEEQNHPDDVEAYLINIHPSSEFQEYGGMGAAFTESACELLSSLPKKVQEEILDAYFDKEKGIGYNFGRVSISSCDFSVSDYTYTEEGDTTLSTFDISHDKKNIIPTIKEALKRSKNLKLFCSPWSPPAYMKTSGSRIGGHLKKDCYSLFASYCAKFIDAYKENGIDIWGITIQNEPRHHQTWESCLYSLDEESEYLGYLGKALKGKKVKILCYDHCRERAFSRLDYIMHSKNAKYLDGVAHHWYSGDHFGELKAVKNVYPKAINVASESCVGIFEEGIHEEYDLSTAEVFAHDIIGAFNNGLNYYCDWNLLLDEKNGPYHNRENRGAWVDNLVYVNTKDNTVTYRRGYYYIGHISKFVETGAKIITSSSYTEELETVAFLNPNGQIVLVVLNRTDKELPAIVCLHDNVLEDKIKPHSMKTFVIEEK